MRCSFIVPEEAYKAKAAYVVFLILKKTYLPSGSVIIFSTVGAVPFVITNYHKSVSFLART